MRYSKLLIPTVKEVPAEAEIPSHQLMIRAGFIRKVASGTYSYLPLGWRCLRKIMEIVRQEMDAAGAQEVSLPILQPIELWRQTGRDVDYGENLCKFQDRHGRNNCLAPTAEEVMADLISHEVSSYKQLPINLYQINEKFRDEFRPRFGVLRSREFIMKDAYSFDADLAGLDRSYQAMYKAYCRIFTRCGLKYVVVQAESGEIGGSGSQEFMIPTETGEDVIVHTPDMAYAANLEKAEVDAVPKAPPIANAPAMAEVHTPNVGSIEAVCNFLGTTPADMIKTLIYWEPDVDLWNAFDNACGRLVKHIRDVEKESPDVADAFWGAGGARESGKYYSLLNRLLLEAPETPLAKRIAASETAGQEMGRYCRALAEKCILAVVRGDHQVNEGKLRAFTRRKAQIAPEGLVELISGADVGFAGPMRTMDGLRLVIDHAVAAMAVGVTGANKTDYHMRNVVPGRDFPLEGANVVVADIRNAVPGDKYKGQVLEFARGIEVGHVFKLGSKYSEALSAKFLDEGGVSHPCLMGCYGIGINRILASAIELYHDANGCVLPVTVAPFEVEVLGLNLDKPPVMAEAERIHDELAAAGVEVLLDDRDVRPGVKFKDCDLLGIPVRVVVGERALKEGNVEIKRRTDEKPTATPAGEAVAAVRRILDELKAACK
jgi:prolyl-tRNA synthetase